MDDHDVFAVIVAKDTKNKASSAFKLAPNARWFPPAAGGVAETAIIGSREPTPAVALQDDEGSVDCLVLTFSKLMQLDGLGKGIRAGTNTASSHILLGHRGTRGVSGHQYSIVVDDEMRIWLHDYYSKHGTAVGYDKQNADERRVQETWLLAFGPGIRNRLGHLTIDSGDLIIGIEFPNHEGGNAQYLENLRALIDKTKENEVPGVQSLGLDSEAPTEPPSGARTAPDRVLYYKEREIGRGAFGRVVRAIRVRDGSVFAAKLVTPPTTNSQKRRRNEVEPTWMANVRREYTIVESNPHPNIIQVFELREKPEVMIIMSYFPSGNIVEAGICDESRLVTAVGQILDCLTFLHGRGVTHRDIKPDNVLVELQPHFKVVLSDFGMSKTVTETTWLQTFFGTLKYIAPEVFPFRKTAYGPPADVWSLGVMALEWLHGIPAAPVQPAPIPAHNGVSPNQWQEGMDVDLLRGMLVADQAKSLRAQQCLMMGLGDGMFRRRAVDGLVECAVVGKEEAHSGRPRADAEDDGLDATVIAPDNGSPVAPIGPFQPALSSTDEASSGGVADVDGSSGESSRIFVRSGAPPPSSSSIRG